MQEIPAADVPLVLLGAVRAAEHGNWGMALTLDDALEPEVALRVIIEMLLAEIREVAQLRRISTAEVLERLEAGYRLAGVLHSSGVRPLRKRA